MKAGDLTKDSRIFLAVSSFFRRTDKLLWLLMLTISTFSLILLKSVSRAMNTDYFKTQLVVTVAGLLAALVLSFIDYESIASFWYLIAGFSVFIMLYTMFFGISVQGSEGVNARAWISLAGRTFQTSELVKICFMLTYAKHISVLRVQNKINHPLHVVLLALHAAVPVLLCHVQGDDGAAIVFFFMFLCMSLGGGVQLRDEAARIYAFPDGTVYHFAVRPVQDKYGIPYTEVMATDVTQLATLHAALQQENERLADANRRAKRLYDNMPDIVREEEILKMKMRVHDDIGHTLLAARRALRHEHDLARLRSEAAKWESSISLLCRARQENAAEDPLSYMQRRAAVLGAAVQLRGAYPAARATRELYALILRECTSNGVRHAGATELYADSEHRPQAWHLCITNNGAPPKAEIKEGGGLSSLRRRIENAGGTVTVQSLPVFVLEVTLPDKESTNDTRYDR